MAAEQEAHRAAAAALAEEVCAAPRRAAKHRAVLHPPRTSAPHLHPAPYPAPHRLRTGSAPHTAAAPHPAPHRSARSSCCAPRRPPAKPHGAPQYRQPRARASSPRTSPTRCGAPGPTLGCRASCGARARRGTGCRQRRVTPSWRARRARRARRSAEDGGARSCSRLGQGLTRTQTCHFWIVACYSGARALEVFSSYIFRWHFGRPGGLGSLRRAFLCR